MTKIQYAVSRQGDAFFKTLSKRVETYLKTLPNGRLILVPIFVVGIPWSTVLLGFLALHVVLSYFFLLTNILNHHVEEADFPGLSADGQLPYNWAEHQMATCLDYRPTSKWLNFFFGGFNSHCAHHLFPSVCHVHYVPITQMIIQAADEYGLEHQHTTWWKALKSHFRHLKALGRRPPGIPH